MKTRIQNKIIGCAAICALMPQAAPGASFIMLNDPSLSTGFEQRWNQSAIWQYVEGVDDGTPGIPDGADTFTINRNTGAPWPGGADATDLSNEGMTSLVTVAGITATGAPGRDMILKYQADVVIGNLTVLTSTSVFEIAEERNRDLTINGVISGSGDLLFSSAGGFSTVAPGDEITITGASPNTFTGTIRFTTNGGADDGGYWVADKVGAFGQASSLTIDGSATSIVSQLILTANTIGGGGAIDDVATAVILGLKGQFNVAAGVDEVIGSGNLTVDGIGVIADGTYTNSESWITGDGTITVGIPEPGSIALLGLGGLLGFMRRRR